VQRENETTTDSGNDQKKNDESKALGHKRAVLSVFAAAIGVQSKENLNADFKQGKPLRFIIYGVLFTSCFVVSLILLASMIAKTSHN
jgi:uncharacterized transporter YbjL